ncbi:MAG: hypothetical protein SPD81_01055 [Candidatus Faecousia sp.]|nr:hypothetical protein [Candidatus Faecousia sp.]
MFLKNYQFEISSRTFPGDSVILSSTFCDILILFSSGTTFLSAFPGFHFPGVTVRNIQTPTEKNSENPPLPELPGIGSAENDRLSSLVAAHPQAEGENMFRLFPYLPGVRKLSGFLSPSQLR